MRIQRTNCRESERGGHWRETLEPDVLDKNGTGPEKSAGKGGEKEVRRRREQEERC